MTVLERLREHLEIQERAAALTYGRAGIQGRNISWGKLNTVTVNGIATDNRLSTIAECIYVSMEAWPATTRALEIAVQVLRQESMCPVCKGWECDHYNRQNTPVTRALAEITRIMGADNG